MASLRVEPAVPAALPKKIMLPVPRWIDARPVGWVRWWHVNAERQERGSKRFNSIRNDDCALPIYRSYKSMLRIYCTV